MRDGYDMKASLLDDAVQGMHYGKAMISYHVWPMSATEAWESDPLNRRLASRSNPTTRHRVSRQMVWTSRLTRAAVGRTRFGPPWVARAGAGVEGQVTIGAQMEPIALMGRGDEGPANAMPCEYPASPSVILDRLARSRTWALGL
jgi:hypothetical protein